jgi:hypothetical protein
LDIGKVKLFAVAIAPTLSANVFLKKEGIAHNHQEFKSPQVGTFLFILSNQQWAEVPRHEYDALLQSFSFIRSLNHKPT